MLLNKESILRTADSIYKICEDSKKDYYLCLKESIESLDPVDAVPYADVKGVLDEFRHKYPKNYSNEPKNGGNDKVFSLNDVYEIFERWCEIEIEGKNDDGTDNRQ